MSVFHSPLVHEPMGSPHTSSPPAPHLPHIPHSSPCVDHGEHRVPSHSPPSDFSVAQGAQHDHWERQALSCHPILCAVLRLVAAFARVQNPGGAMGRAQVATCSRPQAYASGQVHGECPSRTPSYRGPRRRRGTYHYDWEAAWLFRLPVFGQPYLDTLRQILPPVAVDCPEGQQAFRAVLVHRHRVQYCARTSQGWSPCERGQTTSEPDLGGEECGGRTRAQASHPSGRSGCCTLPVHHRPSRCLDPRDQHRPGELQRRNPGYIWSRFLTDGSPPTMDCRCRQEIDVFVGTLVYSRIYYHYCHNISTIVVARTRNTRRLQYHERWKS